MRDGFVTRREITARGAAAGGSYEEIDATATGGGGQQPVKIYSRRDHILNANSGFLLRLTRLTAHCNAYNVKVQFRQNDSIYDSVPHFPLFAM